MSNSARTRLVVRPDDLILLAKRLDSVSTIIDVGVSRLESQLAAVGKSISGPHLQVAAFGRRHRAVAGDLGRGAQATAHLSGHVERSAAEARAADNDSSVARPNPSVVQLVAWTAAMRAARSAQLVAETVATVVGPPLGRANQPSPMAKGHRQGDRGGTYSIRRAGSWAAADGRSTVSAGLTMVADPAMLAPDEFGLVVHDSNNGAPVYTVVLPGVVDLSRPGPGFDPDHRSVRDLDMAAVPSAATGGHINHYATMVSTALDRLELPPGARLNLIGHSFGAATAVRLAEDPEFNGERYDVTTVVAAGYYLRDVKPAAATTSTLVIENNNDLVVAAERLALDPLGSDSDEAVTFAGGWNRFGHDPVHYRRFVEDTTATPVTQLFDHLDADGLTGSGTVWAIDVSVPEPGVDAGAPGPPESALESATAWRDDETSDKNSCHV